MTKTALRVLCAVTVAAAVASCGIPTTQYLGPVDADSIVWTASPATVTFEHNALDNSTENFLGYEIYYKFYAQTPNPTDGQFGTDLAVIDAAAPGTGLNTVLNQQFRRITGANTASVVAPLIPVDPSDSTGVFAISLIFPDKASQLSPDPTTAQYLAEVIELARQPDTGLFGETFESDDLTTSPNDADIPAGIPPTDLFIHMGIVILAYGTDNTGGTFQTLYSNPQMVLQPLEIILQ